MTIHKNPGSAQTPINLQMLSCCITNICIQLPEIGFTNYIHHQKTKSNILDIDFKTNKISLINIILLTTKLSEYFID